MDVTEARGTPFLRHTTASHDSLAAAAAKNFQAKLWAQTGALYQNRLDRGRQDTSTLKPLRPHLVAITRISPRLAQNGAQTQAS